jgi:hypothetical protein
MEFTKATGEDILETSFTGYIVTTYEHLVECLGEPHERLQEGHSGYEKTRAEWAFKFEGKELTVITIYDYKEIIPIDKVTTWHVGSKGEPEQIERFFRETGLSERAEPLNRGLLF